MRRPTTQDSQSFLSVLSVDQGAIGRRQFFLRQFTTSSSRSAIRIIGEAVMVSMSIRLSAARMPRFGRVEGKVLNENRILFLTHAGAGLQPG